jgi:hypothetical protein
MMTDQEFVYPYELVEKNLVKYIYIYTYIYWALIMFFVTTNITRKPKDLLYWNCSQPLGQRGHVAMEGRTSNSLYYWLGSLQQ